MLKIFKRLLTIAYRNPLASGYDLILFKYILDHRCQVKEKTFQLENTHYYYY